jgi:thiol:disulfide interchange protein DsbG
MKRRLVLTAAASAAVLAACGKNEGTPGAAGGKSGAPVPVSVEAIAAEAKGFNVGSTMSTRVVYVFFDTQCPHCAVLWEAARPLRPQARFVWIPVGLIGEKSVAQGAAIVSAADPIATMDENEKSVIAKGGGIAAMGVTDAQKDVVKKNTELFNRFGFTGVPTIVGKHAQTGEIVTIEGSLPAPGLAQRLGLNQPGG